MRLLKFAKFLLVRHRRCSVKKAVLKNFAKFRGKHMCKKKTLTQVFSCEFYETFRKTFFTERLRVTASVCSSVYSSWVKAIKLLKAQHFTIFLTEKTKNIKLQHLTADEERTLLSLAFFERFSLGEFIWIKEIFVKLIGRIWKKGYSSATGTIDLPAVKGRIIFRIWENSRKENTILQNVSNSISDYTI